jgi:hypothetical protein
VIRIASRLEIVMARLPEPPGAPRGSSSTVYVGRHCLLLTVKPELTISLGFADETGTERAGPSMKEVGPCL